MLTALNDIMLYTPKLQSFAFALQFQILAHSLLLLLSPVPLSPSRRSHSAAAALGTI